MQAHDARQLLKHLESPAEGSYTEEEQQSDWFCDFVRSLRLLVSSVSPKGVRRGHLVAAFPGSLLQEFYTTDGSGTCVAQDVYQGLGCATRADTSSILELLGADSEEPVESEAVEASCAAAEFFVWRRDEVVLGCGQLVAHSVQESGKVVAELRHLSCALGTFVANAPALFAYAERAAVLGGAPLMAVRRSQDPERNAWFASRGFKEPSESQSALLPQSLRGPGIFVKRLGETSEKEAEEAIAAYAEEPSAPWFLRRTRHSGSYSEVQGTFLQILHGKPCGSIFDKLLVHAFKTPFSPFPLGVTFCRIGYVASPSSSQDKPPAAVQSVEKRQKPRSVSHGLTAVGLPMPWGAATPTSSVVQGQLAPAMHATGQATSSLWACIVAGAGAVGHNIRQQNREPRRQRHGRRGPSRQTTAASTTSVVEVEQLQSEAELAGWQTASEDEDERSEQIGHQQRMQFMQQVMQHEMQQQQQHQQQQQPDRQGMAFFNQQQQQQRQQRFPQQNSQQPQMQFYDAQQFHQQQVLYWPNQMQQHAVNPQQFNHQMQMQMQQAMSQQPQLQAFAPMPQMQQMVLVAVPVVPENAPVAQGDEPAPQVDMEQLRNFSMGNRAPSVSSTPSEISMEMGSSVSTQTPSHRAERAATSRWNGKESEAVVRQLRAPGLDAASRKRLMERIVQDAWSMAITKHGTRVVQAAFEISEVSEKQNLLDVLKGKVWQALKSPHANHVLQKAIAHMPPQKLDFIVFELRGRVGDAARHPFGCRVLERLLEHGWPEQLEPIAKEVLSDVLELCRHPYGNYVVQHSLAHGNTEQRTRLCQAMRPEMGRLARHKVASHVVECALLHSSPEERERLKNAMAGNAEELASLTASNYGSFVVKEMKKR
eukprot:s2572_g7.t1